jgi:uncharacterized damage-inducible protein DinB
MFTRALCLLLAASSLGAQATKSAAAPESPVGNDVRALWLQSADYLARAAAAVPESTYSFRPTPAVRTFGQLIGHVAGSQYAFCATAMGQKAPAEDEIEKTRTTKGALIEALTQSTAYCQKAYAQSDVAIGATVDVFGSPATKRYALILNATHNYEHYGNVVTYMRMNGLVPPSSQPAK